MKLEDLVKKYKNENKSIMNRRPDLTIQGDFTPDGIKLFCNNGFIEDLKSLRPNELEANKQLIKDNYK